MKIFAALILLLLAACAWAVPLQTQQAESVAPAPTPGKVDESNSPAGPPQNDTELVTEPNESADQSTGQQEEAAAPGEEAEARNPGGDTSKEAAETQAGGDQLATGPITVEQAEGEQLPTTDQNVTQPEQTQAPDQEPAKTQAETKPSELAVIAPGDAATSAATSTPALATTMAAPAAALAAIAPEPAPAPVQEPVQEVAQKSAESTQENPVEPEPEQVAPKQESTEAIVQLPEASKNSTEPKFVEQRKQLAPNSSEFDRLNQIPDSSGMNYYVDKESCAGQLGAIPEAIMNMTIERILSKLSSANCSRDFDLKLPPLLNRQIRGQIMEVSSMPIDLVNLIGAEETRVECLNNVSSSNNGEFFEFKLKFAQTLADQKLRSRWRHYPRLHLDDIPLAQVVMFNSKVSDKKGAKLLSPANAYSQPAKLSSKCQKFKFEQGQFYLDLLSFKSELQFDIKLKKINGTAYLASEKLGGSIRLNSMKISNLYLEHELINLDNFEGRQRQKVGQTITNNNQTKILSLANNGPRPSVQVIHEHNNYYRRNNWLLEMYANWLRHEYGELIKNLFVNHQGSMSIIEQLNRSCLIDY